MPLKFQCSECNTDLVVLNLDRGKYAECPGCGSLNPVPEIMEPADRAPNCRISSKLPEKKSGQINTDNQSANENETVPDASGIQADAGGEEIKKTDNDTTPDVYYNQTETQSPQDNIRVTFDNEKRITIISFRDYLKKLSPRIYVTPVLIGINIIVFILMSIAGVPLFSPEPESLFAWGIKYSPLIIQNNEWWRLVTCTFVHAGIFHLLSNMAALFIIGYVCERLFGSIPFLLIYIAAAIGGNTAGLLLNAFYSSAGASGAIMGIAGALIPFLTLEYFSVAAAIKSGQTGPGSINRNAGILFLFSRRIILIIIALSTLSIITGFFVPYIDNMGHVGGFLSGIGIGFILWKKPGRIKIDEKPGTGRIDNMQGAESPAEKPKLSGNRRIAIACAAIAGVFVLAVAGGTFLVKPYLPVLNFSEYYRKGQYIRALETMKENQDLFKKIPNGMQFEAVVYGNAGWEYYMKDDFKSCIELSQKAYEIDPVLALYARYNIALCYLRLGDVEKSRALYTELESSSVKIEIEAKKGVIQDLKDLIEKNIHAAEAREILIDIFKIPEKEL